MLERTQADVIDCVPVPLLVCKEESLVIVEANALAVEMYRCDGRERLIGRSIPFVSRPATAAGISVHRRCDHQLIDVETRIAPLKEGLVIVALRDVTEERRSLEMLSRDGERFRLVVRATSDAIWEWDLRNRSLWWNEAFERLFGYAFDRQKSTMDFWFERIPADERSDVAEGITHLLYDSADQFWTTEHGFTRADGSEATVYDRAYVVRDEKGNALKMIGSMMDVTEQRRTEAALRRSEKLSTMGALLAGVAHEVRNPLFAMSAICDAFEAEQGSRPETQRYFSFLRGELNRLRTLMQELLDFGKSTPPERVRTSLGDVINSTVRREQRVATEAGVLIDVLIESDLPRVDIDVSRMLQVFGNLLENAIQHSRAGGTIAVRARSVFRNDSEFIECSVRDHGPGLPAGDLERIFEPFYTRRKGGTGMGLAIVQRIVEEHGGTIRAANHPGGGAVMTLWLPVAAPTSEGR